MAVDALTRAHRHLGQLLYLFTHLVHFLFFALVQSDLSHILEVIIQSVEGVEIVPGELEEAAHGVDSVEFVAIHLIVDSATDGGKGIHLMFNRFINRLIRRANNGYYYSAPSTLILFEAV